MHKIIGKSMILVVCSLLLFGMVVQMPSGQARSGSDTPSSADIKELVKQLEEAGEFNNDRAARALKIHLTAVDLFENQKAAEKIVKHMNGFKQLLENQKKNKMISDKAFKTLNGEASSLIRKWQKYDVILRNGVIIDGTGDERYKGDIGITGDRIAYIGNLSYNTADTEIDLKGMYVTPGFINIHSHATPTGLQTAENMLTQGVTTEILNSDGGGPVGIGTQLKDLEKAGLAVNVGAYIGFNSVWGNVVGNQERQATSSEITRMQELIETGLKQGAWGVSGGLDYTPGNYADTREVIQVLKVAEKWRTNFPNHERLTPESNYSSVAGIAETIEIGEGSGVTPVITHIKAQGQEQGNSAEIISMMNEATARGNYTTSDVYPYLAGQTGLHSLLIPSWAQDGGFEAMLERFKDPALREQIIQETEHTMNVRFGGPSGVFIPGLRKELVDVMNERDVGAGEALLSVLEEEGQQSAILRFGVEEDLENFLKNPTTSVACDCGSSKNASHPRYFGTFPRVLGKYVREQGLLTWEDAVRKMTGLPATTIGMVDRGFLAPGMAADITVFNPNTIIDNATFDQPELRSDGVQYVMVNGKIALAKGEVTGEQAGQSLLRSKYMPTRPMSNAIERQVTAKGPLLKDEKVKGNQAVQVSVELSQKAGSRAVSGEIRINDPAGNMHLETTKDGMLQTTDGWASYTGLARNLNTGETHTVTVIIDKYAPFVPDKEVSMTIEVDNGYKVSGYLKGKPVEISER